jgi:16S rRNA (uracil1498-N3)-methyltransferase
MHHFLCPIQENQSFYTLDLNDSHHLSVVLRAKRGDIIQILDGKGGLHEAQILILNPKQTQIEIKRRLKQEEPRSYKIQIAFCPTKNIDRTEWFIEKACELGVDEIILFTSARSERKTVNMERLERIVRAAVKQSLHLYYPILQPLCTFDVLLEKNAMDEVYVQKYIAHCQEEKKTNIFNLPSIKNNFLLLIGPEGDFTNSELKKAENKNFFPISLGDFRLRTETAALFSVFEMVRRRAIG